MSDTGSISGTVIDQSTNLAIQGATVNLSDGGDQSATTDSKGRFGFQNLPEGEATLTISKQDYQEGNFGPLKVLPGMPLDLRLPLQPSNL